MEDVTFGQLRTFVCAAQAGSFAKAAEQLGISQPAVSEQIKALEDRLGRHLFERRRGTTSTLSVKGEEALEAVQAILGISQGLFENAQGLREKSVLRLSAGPFLRENYLRALLPRLYRDYPDIEFDFRPAAPAEEVGRLLEKGELDLAIFAILAEEEAPPDTRQVCELPMVMIAPAGTNARLASGKSSLSDYQYIFPGRREMDSRWARKFLRNLGLPPSTPLLFTEFVEAAAQMVEDGQGIGHLAAQTVADRVAAGRIETLDIPLSPMRRLIGRSPHAPAIAKAIEGILAEALSRSPSRP